MSVLYNPLSELKEYEEFRKTLLSGKEAAGITGVMDSQKVHLMSTFIEDCQCLLVVTWNELRAREICDDFRFFTQDVYYLPPKDLIFFSADLSGNAIAAARMKAILPILSEKNCIIVTTVDALMNAMPPAEKIRSAVMEWKSGDELDLDRVGHRLVLNGYSREARVDEPGQFSMRGGILDIFPLTEEVPVRVELFGDEIDQIKSFDVETQRSIEKLDAVTVFPATELVLSDEARNEGRKKITEAVKRQAAVFREKKLGERSQRVRDSAAVVLQELEGDTVLSAPEGYVRFFYKKTVSLLDYLPKKTLVFLDEPVRLTERGDGIAAEYNESMRNRLEQGYLLPEQADLLTPVEAVLSRLSRPGTAVLASLDNRQSGVARKNYSLQVQNMNSYKEDFSMLLQELLQWQKEKYRVVFLCPSHTRGRRITEQLVEAGLHAYYSEESGRKVEEGDICVTYGQIHRGFVYPLLRYAIITDSDVFGARQRQKARRRDKEKKKIQDYSELSPGDYVIHDKYGLGIFRGSERQEIDRVTKDYLKIEYADGSSLFIPVTQLDSISKYADSESKPLKLNKLGTQDWGKTKSKVQKAVDGVAKDLVELYAARSEAKGYAFSEDTPWQKEFEEDFPFEETADQMNAIESTKRDMESGRIMDRLVCGDVGYGKTEIAIRAAFKAVQDSKQVAYLCPTTVLAQQVYNSFVQRMKNYPVTIRMLSRFQTPAQNQMSLKDMAQGNADIVVGTHRLLSSDVKFHDLGLLIVDEEQRFGVTHKEKIKKMKQNVDVLTLTATPIPRTLHMSLIGIRDMSVLEEPPQNRRPIQTYVMEMNWEMVREAVNRELARDGQVYYVYNRVTDIDKVAAQIQALVPDAVVSYAHGQMDPRRLERIMMDFVQGEIDVLVSTTIIETGLDIPNVNTIIIQDADRFGLSQLYQLRGRVGRSARTAYAFILYRQGKILREVAEKRLTAIREYTELGSGIKIAMRDLEIRGAGNLLGEAQSGHIENVGYGLYCKMLNEAVLKQTGRLSGKEQYETTVDLPISAFIPDTFIKAEDTRIDIYKKIASISSVEESEDIIDELIDRFGDVPKPVKNLIDVAVLRFMAHEVYITELRSSAERAKLQFFERAKLDVGKIPDLVRSYNGELRFLAGSAPYLLYTPKKVGTKGSRMSVEGLKKLLTDIKLLLMP